MAWSTRAVPYPPLVIHPCVQVGPSCWTRRSQPTCTNSTTSPQRTCIPTTPTRHRASPLRQCPTRPRKLPPLPPPPPQQRTPTLTRQQAPYQRQGLHASCRTRTCRTCRTRRLPSTHSRPRRRRWCSRRRRRWTLRRRPSRQRRRWQTRANKFQLPRRHVKSKAGSSLLLNRTERGLQAARKSRAPGPWVRRAARVQLCKACRHFRSRQ